MSKWLRENQCSIVGIPRRLWQRRNGVERACGQALSTGLGSGKMGLMSMALVAVCIARIA